MELIRVAEGQAEEAAQVLATSFADYPFLKRSLAGATEPVEAMTLLLFRIAVRYRLSAGYPVLSASEGGRIVGVANLTPPPSVGPDVDWGETWEEFDSKLSQSGRSYMDEYERVQAEAKPKEPHVYVPAIGVMPGHQGRGIGRGLLDAASEYAESLDVAGIALDTHDQGNVEKYRSLGFELIAVTKVLDLQNYYFWRPCGARMDGSD